MAGESSPREAPAPKRSDRGFRAVLAAFAIPLFGRLMGDPGHVSAQAAPPTEVSTSIPESQQLNYLNQVLQADLRKALPANPDWQKDPAPVQGELRTFADMYIPQGDKKQKVTVLKRETASGELAQLGVVVYETPADRTRPTTATLADSFQKYYPDFPTNITTDQWTDALSPHTGTPSFEVLIPNPDGTTTSWAATQTTGTDGSYGLIRSTYTDKSFRFQGKAPAVASP